MFRLTHPLLQAARCCARGLRSAAPVLAWLVLLAGFCMPAQAQNGRSRTGLSVTMPNGFATIALDDMSLKSSAGDIRWSRHWNGQEWRFNPHWESLSQSWRNLTGSQTADSTGGPSSSGGNGGNCWITADEDWQPPAANDQGLVPMLPARSTPFNRAMPTSGLAYPEPRRVLLDHASLCPGLQVDTGTIDAEAFRRYGGLYAGNGDAFAHSNRYLLRKQPVRALPAVPSATPYERLSTGQMGVTPQTLANGFRWQDRAGDWIDYDNAGRAVAQGDRNDNTVWLQRDASGLLRGVVDAQGRVLYTLHYTGDLLTEVKDYPIAGHALDLPARSVRYQYDTANRLTLVTDVRGYATRFDYDSGNHIVRVTDAEGRVEALAYKGDTVLKRTAPDGAVTDYSFEFDTVNKQYVARITGPETAAGRRVDDITHNRAGQLVRLVTNGRTDAQVSYDAGARTEALTNARGFTARTSRNEFDQVVQVQQTDGSVVAWTYSAAHLQQMSFTDEAGIRSAYQRDAKGNATRLTQAEGTQEQRVTTFDLNSLGQVTALTTKGRTELDGSTTPDATWQFRYDPQGQLSQTIDPEGHTRQYAYNRAGQLVRETDPRNNATAYEVDAAGNLLSATSALGQTRRLAYDKVGNLVSVTDARLKTLRSRYDAMNRLVQTTSAVGGIQQWQYDAQGNLLRRTDEDGRSDRFEFDTFLRLTRSVDGLGHATDHGYQVPDAPGQLASLYSPGQTQFPTFVQRSSYDARERLVRRSVVNSNRQGTETLNSSIEYDTRSLVIREVDAYGKASSSRYNALRQLIESTDRIGAVTRMAYDVRGNLLSLTDANGHTHRFTYDRNDRLLSEALPLGQAIRYEYDSTGNLARRTDRNGNVFTYTHDAANRLVELRAVNAAGALQRTTTFTWDAEDNLTAWVDTDAVRQQTARSELRYDDASRLAGETVTFPNGNTSTHGYRYSPAGLKTAIVWPDGTEIGYGYSAHGALETVTIPGEGSINIQQYRWMAPQRTIYPGGVVREDSYDGLLSLEGTTVGKPTEPSLLSLSHRYGKLQELTEAHRTDTIGTASTTRSSTYTYDVEVRLRVAATSTGTTTDTETFELDPLGNRTRHSRVSGAWAYDDNHRLTRSGEGGAATHYEWDTAGNLVRSTAAGGKVTVYEYDVLNRLSTVKDGVGNLIARYGYDPFDRRIWREVYRDIQGTPLAEPYRVLYAYNEEGLLAESQQAVQIDAAGVVSSTTTAEPRARYGQQPDSLFSTGALFVSTKDRSGRSIVAYLQSGHLEQPMQAVTKDGSVAWAATQSTFGEASQLLQAPEIDVRNRFPGQFEDEETGLFHNFRRYYHPQMGRYVTADPVGLFAGPNLYWYGSGSPNIYIDPTGEFWPLWCIAGIGLGALLDEDCYEPWEALRDCALGLIPLKIPGLGALIPKFLPIALKPLIPKAAQIIPDLPRILPKSLPKPIVPATEKAGAGLASKAGAGVANKAGAGAAQGLTNADAVIAETLAGKGNITSATKLSADDLLKAGEKFLGTGYKEIGKPGSGVFRSADGTRQFRIDSGSLTGGHKPGVPHGHLEVYKPGAAKPTVNNHIPFFD